MHSLSKILITFIIMAVLIGIFLSEIDSAKKIVKYCNNHGWEGIESMGYFSNDYKCYKYVPSPTGIGKDIVYSGEFWVGDIE